MSDTPEPFIRQQRRIQDALVQIATDDTQSPDSKRRELDRVMRFLLSIRLPVNAAPGTVVPGDVHAGEGADDVS